MKRFTLVLAALLVLCGLASAQNRDSQIERIQNAGTVLNEIMNAADKDIPAEILGSAKCVAVVPSMLKGGFIFGGEYGHGVASCRTEKGWSAPAFFDVEGGSFGLQIGGQAVDLIMVVMNDNGMKALLSSKFKLGVDGSVAAGPVGRHAEGMTDLTMRAEVLTYSRARGAFAGVTLNGAVIKQAQDDTRVFYGRMVPYRTLLNGGFAAPAEAEPFLSALRKYSGTNTAAATPPAPRPVAAPVPVIAE
jgi:SH3 domain-containing YSC84-like protein 1